MRRPQGLRYALDNLEVRRNWGLDADSSGPAKEDLRFKVSRIETLTMGFSLPSHLECPSFREEEYEKGRQERVPPKTEKLIRLVRDHRLETGMNIEEFRLEYNGDPLLSDALAPIVEKTEESVNRFSVNTALTMRNAESLDFLIAHPKIDRIRVSCDAGDAETFERMNRNRTSGISRACDFSTDPESSPDFDQVWSRAGKLRQAGKAVKIVAVVVQENMTSLMEMPKRLHADGLHELHISYPLNTTRFLKDAGFEKPNLQQLREFFLRIRDECEARGIVLTTDPWVFLPAMTGVIPDIDTPDLYEEYQKTPCDLLWRLTLHRDATFHHCGVLSAAGLDRPRGKRPFDQCESLLDLANSEEALRFRGLHLSGSFPLPCRKICRKIAFERDPAIASLLLEMKNGSVMEEVSVDEWLSGLANDPKKIVVRTFTEGVRKFMDAFPDLRQHIDYIVDRNESIDCDLPAMTPDAASMDGTRPNLLLGSNLGSIYHSVAERPDQFSDIFRLVVVGNDPADFKIQKIKI